MEILARRMYPWYLLHGADCIVAEFPGSRGEPLPELRADVMQIYVGDDILSQ